MELPDACRLEIAAWADFPSSDGWTGNLNDLCEQRLGLSLAATTEHYERFCDSDYLVANVCLSEDDYWLK